MCSGVSYLLEAHTEWEFGRARLGQLSRAVANAHPAGGCDSNPAHSLQPGCCCGVFPIEIQVQGLTNYQAAHVFCKLPSLLEYFGFVFAFGNLLGGSVIEFQDYRMWVNRQGPWAQTTDRKVPWTGDMMAVSAAAAAGVIF